MSADMDSGDTDHLARKVKACCATAYESDWARLLLGDSFHPGGLALTRHIGETLDLGPGMRVLDVASGNGTSAVFLARTFGCEILGVDYGEQNVRAAELAATAGGVGALARFMVGDAERLPAPDGSFDAVICECAFCTFPDKSTAAAELARVLRPGGRVGLMDLTREGAVEEVPPALHGLLAWVACIADAQLVDDYVRFLTDAGLRVTVVKRQDDALAELVHDIRGKLLGAELLLKLKRIELPGADFAQARTIARAAADAVRAHQFGYVLMTAEKPSE